MQPGDEYPAAHMVALSMFREALDRLLAEGRELPEGSTEYDSLKKAIVPPYDPGKFANKWRKIDAREPVRTITAHLGKDSYSHIHYSDEQARTISVREAARLQSFPDGFTFAGTLDPALKQIGNSVPPLFAAAIGRSIIGQVMASALLVERRA
jgi:DNA (cytosine-5)-methyltransferase 1